MVKMGRFPGAKELTYVPTLKGKMAYHRGWRLGRGSGGDAKV